MSYKSPRIPAEAGTQCFREAQVRGINFNANPVMPIRPQDWVPAFAGMSGTR